jgi:hypothetical protein
MKKNLAFLYILVSLSLAACNLAGSAEIVPTATLAPGATVPAGAPQSEAGVPRVAVEEAKAAVDRGEAVIVDVRSQGAFEANHIAGARFITLGVFETDPGGVDLDKEQWIITYCT